MVLSGVMQVVELYRYISRYTNIHIQVKQVRMLIVVAEADGMSIFQVAGHQSKYWTNVS